MQKGFYLFIYSTSLADKSEEAVFWLTHNWKVNVEYVSYKSE